MKFHLSFDIKKLPEPIDHQHGLLLMGSCFTENMGEKLKKNKFQVMENPNGILFNPVSVAEAITDYMEHRRFQESDFFSYMGGWHSWRHHSRFSALSLSEAVERVNTATSSAHHFLKQADYLMITLGSAWVYTLTEKANGARVGSVAGNNHKAPQDWFYRRLLGYEEVLQVLDNVIHRLFLFNPKLKIIFTISPVRHLREGLVENNRSKAVLIQAVHHLVDKFNKLYYFPAYELVIDDLRDYRFYAEDLVHPNYAATQYVWEKFVDACMDEKTKLVMEELQVINRAFTHKPFHESSEQHLAFLKSFFERTSELKNKFPFLDLKKELEYFSSGKSQ